MSEVAADTPDGRRRRQQKLTARIPAKPWGGSLLKSTRAPQVTTPYRGAASAAAVRQGERHCRACARTAAWNNYLGAVGVVVGGVSGQGLEVNEQRSCRCFDVAVDLGQRVGIVKAITFVCEFSSLALASKISRIPAASKNLPEPRKLLSIG